MNTWSLKRKIIFVISCLGFLSLALVLFPAVRIFIISITENFLLHRKLEDPSKWHNLMLTWSIRGILFFAIIIFWMLWKQFKLLLGLAKRVIISLKQIKTINEAIHSITEINYKQFIKPVLIMFGVYTLGISAIIRADFLYIDDIGRSIYGYRFSDWSRYISNFLSIIIHTDARINDTSPLTQLIAAFLIAASSVALVYVINDGKITKTALVASLPVGLSPFFLECFSWRFDSPYMALSVFASIVPFIFVKNWFNFTVVSILSLLVMCMTYQAASGIYIIIVIMLCFHQLNMRQKTSREIFSFLGISTISYCLALILFRVFLMKPADHGYASTSFYPLQQLITGVVHNIAYYKSNIEYDFNLIWKNILMFSGISFCAKSLITTKQHKLCVFFISLAVIVLMAVLSLGVYIVLDRPNYILRYMLGFGIFIAILGIYTAGSPKKVLVLPALALCWCFYVFSFSYGNALTAQKIYIEFRTEMFLHDLAILYPERYREEQLPIQIIGWGGHAPIISNIAAKNPIITRLVPVYFVENWIWGPIAMRHYNINFQQFEDNIDESEFENIFNSMYHTIKSDGKQVLVYLK